MAVALAEKMNASRARGNAQACALCGQLAALGTHLGTLSGDGKIDDRAVAEVFDEFNFGGKSPLCAELEIAGPDTRLHRLVSTHERGESVFE
jgi:hypothetical protein